MSYAPLPGASAADARVPVVGPSFDALSMDVPGSVQVTGPSLRGRQSAAALAAAGVLGLALALTGSADLSTTGVAVAAGVLGYTLPGLLGSVALRLLLGDRARLHVGHPDPVEAHLVVAGVTGLPWGSAQLTGDHARDARARLVAPLVNLVMLAGFTTLIVVAGSTHEAGISASAVGLAVGWSRGGQPLRVLARRVGRVQRRSPVGGGLGPLVPGEAAVVRVGEIRTGLGRYVNPLEAVALSRWGASLVGPLDRLAVAGATSAGAVWRAQEVVAAAVCHLAPGPPLLLDHLRRTADGLTAHGAPRTATMVHALARVGSAPADALELLSRLPGHPSAHLVRTAALLALGDVAGARVALGPPPTGSAALQDPYPALALACGRGPEWVALVRSRLAVDPQQGVCALVVLAPDAALDVALADLSLQHTAVDTFAAAGHVEHVAALTPWVEWAARTDLVDPVKDTAALGLLVLGRVDEARQVYAKLDEQHFPAPWVQARDALRRREPLREDFALTPSGSATILLQRRVAQTFPA